MQHLLSTLNFRLLEISHIRTEEMGQWLRAWATLTENPSLFPRVPLLMFIMIPN